ncbi:unnamed protein product [Adineta ricciae]|uniref:Uncharacterized protein n=1 Tax=Adineta ricciae TaxID=249248 RepID=A0A814N9T8_ADIRI|nr:unnamed protein product [Adineta ricciae]CAF1089249.1 unnamed protein product [Adineta ricciae]
MVSTYVCLIIAMLCVSFNQVLPYPSAFYSDEIPPSILDDLYLTRRQVFDPYGFNSILSRFVDHEPYYNLQKKRTIELVQDDIYDGI